MRPEETKPEIGKDGFTEESNNQENVKSWEKKDSDLTPEQVAHKRRVDALIKSVKPIIEAFYKEEKAQGFEAGFSFSVTTAQGKDIAATVAIMGGEVMLCAESMYGAIHSNDNINTAMAIVIMRKIDRGK